MRRSNDANEFDDYVEHPRFGRGPRYTDVSSVKPGDPHAYIASWRSTRETRVLGTAVAAELTRQTLATMPVLFYFDERRTCVDCGCRFLFFADEQKYWYEELGFKLDADCVRCWPCRYVQQGIDSATARYEQLATLEVPTRGEQMEMLEVGLSLCERRVFGRKVLQRLRAILNQLWPREGGAIERERFETRIVAIEGS